MHMFAPFLPTRPLILASSSPRRHAFLNDQGLPFRAVPPLLPEPKPLPGELPSAYAMRTATAKAEEAIERTLHDNPGSSPLVLAADTIVTLEDDGRLDILGKPASEDEAFAMLRRLAGRTHTVITACCLLPSDGPAEYFADQAHVTFAPWPDDVLHAYVATGEPLDKAGAYGIQSQGAFLVEKIDGSWSTVVGLPMSRVMTRLLALDAIRPARPYY